MTQLPAVVKYKGVRFEWGDTAVIVPPLRVSQVQENAALLLDIDNLRNKVVTSMKAGSVSTDDSNQWRRKEGQVIRMALLRNYPDMKEEDFEDIIDISNSTAMFVAAMGLDQVSERVKKTGEG